MKIVSAYRGVLANNINIPHNNKRALNVWKIKFLCHSLWATRIDVSSTLFFRNPLEKALLGNRNTPLSARNLPQR